MSMRQPGSVASILDTGGSPSARFSVVVPVYGHWQLVPDLLACLDAQSLPTELFEVILVDNEPGSSRPSLALKENVRIVKCEKPGSYAARNLGVAGAHGRWLVFTDADCLPRPDWLEALDRAVKERGDRQLLAGAVNVVGRSPDPSPSEIYEMVKGIPQERYVRRGYAATANLAMSRDLFDLVGGFDGDRLSGGDADFCRRAKARGYPVAFVPEACVDHPARTSWSGVLTKERRIKGGQLTAGPARRRGLWLLRTLAPPVQGLFRFMSQSRHPLRHRIVACSVLMVLWVAGIAEAGRLLTGGKAVR